MNSLRQENPKKGIDICFLDKLSQKKKFKKEKKAGKFEEIGETDEDKRIIYIILSTRDNYLFTFIN